MTDDDTHALRVVFGVALEATAERLYGRIRAFHVRADPAHAPAPWDRLTNHQRNAYRSALADLARPGDLDRLAAAARIMESR